MKGNTDILQAGDTFVVLFYLHTSLEQGKKWFAVHKDDNFYGEVSHYIVDKISSSYIKTIRVTHEGRELSQPYYVPHDDLVIEKLIDGIPASLHRTLNGLREI